MVWSGLTKHINSLVHSHAKAVEIPSFAIFGPLVEQWTDYRDPLAKGPITKRTYQLKNPHFVRTVIAALNEDFVSSAGL